MTKETTGLGYTKSHGLIDGKFTLGIMFGVTGNVPDSSQPEPNDGRAFCTVNQFINLSGFKAILEADPFYPGCFSPDP